MLCTHIYILTTIMKLIYLIENNYICTKYSLLYKKTSPLEPKYLIYINDFDLV